MIIMDMIVWELLAPKFVQQVQTIKPAQIMMTNNVTLEDVIVLACQS